MDEIRMDCPFCGQPVVRVTRPATYRRADRIVRIDTQCWQCPTDCEGPDGSKPFTFYDVHQLKANDENAKVAWLAQYNEPMPPSRLNKP
jgi:hypothetical protein